MRCPRFSGTVVGVSAPEGVTQLLQAWQHGDRAAGEQLVPLVYAELRRIARRRLQAERDGHTLQPTALVNEAWLRLMQLHDLNLQNRVHFYALAAQAMRRILVDHARKRHASRRGSRAEHVPLDADMAAPLPDDRLVALDEALDRLATLEPRHARVVELRYFGGLSLDEVSGVLGISTGTIKRDWRTARAWLFAQIQQPNDR